MLSLPVEIAEIVFGNLTNKDITSVRLTCRRFESVATPLINQELAFTEILDIHKSISHRNQLQHQQSQNQINEQRSHTDSIDIERKLVVGGLSTVLNSLTGPFILRTLSCITFRLPYRLNQAQEILSHLDKHCHGKLKAIKISNMRLCSPNDKEFAMWMVENVVDDGITLDLVELIADNDINNPRETAAAALINGSSSSDSQTNLPWLEIKNNVVSIDLIIEDAFDFASLLELICPASENKLQVLKMYLSMEVVSVPLEPLKKLLKNCYELRHLDIGGYFFEEMTDLKWLPPKLETLRLFNLPHHFTQNHPSVSSLKHLHAGTNCHLIDMVSFPNLESVHLSNYEFERPQELNYSVFFQNSPRLKKFSGAFNNEHDLIRMLQSVPSDACEIEVVRLILWQEFRMGLEWPAHLKAIPKLRELVLSTDYGSRMHYTTNEFVAMISRILKCFDDLEEQSQFEALLFAFNLGRSMEYKMLAPDDELLEIMSAVSVDIFEDITEPILKLDIPKFRETYCPAECAMVDSR